MTLLPLFVLVSSFQTQAEPKPTLVLATVDKPTRDIVKNLKGNWREQAAKFNLTITPIQQSNGEEAFLVWDENAFGKAFSKGLTKTFDHVSQNITKDKKYISISSQMDPNVKEMLKEVFCIIPGVASSIQSGGGEFQFVPSVRMTVLSNGEQKNINVEDTKIPNPIPLTISQQNMIDSPAGPPYTLFRSQISEIRTLVLPAKEIPISEKVSLTNTATSIIMTNIREWESNLRKSVYAFKSKLQEAWPEYDELSNAKGLDFNQLSEEAKIAFRYNASALGWNKVNGQGEVDMTAINSSKVLETKLVYFLTASIQIGDQIQLVSIQFFP